MNFSPPSCRAGGAGQADGGCALPGELSKKEAAAAAAAREAPGTTTMKQQQQQLPASPPPKHYGAGCPEPRPHVAPASSGGPAHGMGWRRRRRPFSLLPFLSLRDYGFCMAALLLFCLGSLFYQLNGGPPHFLLDLRHYLGKATEGKSEQGCSCRGKGLEEPSQARDPSSVVAGGSFFPKREPFFGERRKDFPGSFTYSRKWAGASPKFNLGPTCCQGVFSQLSAGHQFVSGPVKFNILLFERSRKGE